MIMLTQWMQRELPNQSISRLVTKVELARKISVWGQENADNNFQVVARRLFNKGMSIALSFIVYITCVTIVIQETNTIGRRKSSKQTVCSKQNDFSRFSPKLRWTENVKRKGRSNGSI